MPIVMTTNLGKSIKDRLSEPLTPEQLARFDAIGSTKSKDELIFQEELRKRQRRNYTSLLEEDWQVTFESLDIIPQNAEQVARLKKWNPSLSKGVVLYGSVGTGKSTLCKAIINKFASKDYTCLFISVADAMQRLKDAIDRKGSGVSIEQEKLIEPHLLFLDDLGAEKSTEWAVERIFVIFEKRAAQRKHTIFTTNLMPKEIGNIYKERIADRLSEFCSWINFSGGSFRKRDFKNEI